MAAPASSWRDFGAVHPFGDDFRGYTDILPERLVAGLIEEATRTVPRDLVERTFVWGTPQDVARQLEDLIEAGMRAICFIPASFHTQRLTLHTFWALGGIARRLH